MNVNDIMDNKNFLKVLKPNFSNKIVAINKVKLTDAGKIISDTEMVDDIFNKFFVNIGDNLKIDKNYCYEQCILSCFKANSEIQRSS